MSAAGNGSHWPEWMKPGVRVVKGPDWRNTIRDPKAVDLGTLSYVPKNAADNKVQVVWDTGQERGYNSGHKGPYELRAYDTQQVGDSSKGIVQAFVDEKDGLANVWVRVKWEIGHDVKEYRFGVGGYVDVVASKVTQGGKVYTDHLPVIVNPGDKVRVNMRLEEFKKAQSNGNVPGCIKEVGTVVELLYQDIMAKVQFMDSNEVLVVTSALYRVCGFREHDAVEIFRDKKMLRKLQEGHGGMPKDIESVRVYNR